LDLISLGHLKDMSTNDMKEIINRLSKKNQLYEENINVLQEELKKYKDLFTKSEEEKNLLKNENKKQKEEITKLNSIVDKKEEEKNEISIKLQTTSEELIKNQKELSNKEKINGSIQNENIKLKNENNNLEFKYKELEKQFQSSELQNLNKKLTIENNEISLNLNEIQKKFETNRFNMELKEKEFNQLKVSNENNEKKINEFEKEILSEKEKYNLIYKEKQEILSEKDNLQRELNNFKKKNITLENKVKELEKNEEEIKNITEKSKSLNEELLNLKNNIAEKEEAITKLEQIRDEKRHDLKYDKEEFSADKFYDVIIKINSLKDIKKGWEIKLNQENKYDSLIKNRSLRVGVIGNGNKGKSFFLQKLSGKELPKGTSIKTQGLSLLYPKENDMENILLLDSAGFETPLLVDEISKEKNIELKNDNNNENKETNEEDESSQVSQIFKTQEDKSDCESNNNNKNEKNSDKKEDEYNDERKENIYNDDKRNENNYQKISEIAKDKIFTELFLQKLIIEFSDVLLIVIGQLTFAEQKLLNRIKKNLAKNLSESKDKKAQKIFIIHNLQNFVEKYQVENYIKEVLFNSATFKINERERIVFNKNINKKEEKKNYYTENYKNIEIIHLIMANDYSEAGNFYNENTINFVRDSCSVLANRETMDIISKTKESFVKFSKEVFEYNTPSSSTKEKVELVSLKNEDLTFDEKECKIKLKNKFEIKFKQLLVDELGISNFRNYGCEPKYCYYRTKEKDNYYLVIKVEIPGNFGGLNGKCNVEGEYTLFKIFGEKLKDNTNDSNTEETYIQDCREYGKFAIILPLRSSEIHYLKKKAIVDKNPEKGIAIFKFEISGDDDDDDEDDD
jgi:hypothetical protein